MTEFCYYWQPVYGTLTVDAASRHGSSYPKSRSLACSGVSRTGCYTSSETCNNNDVLRSFKTDASNFRHKQNRWPTVSRMHKNKPGTLQFCHLGYSQSLSHFPAQASRGRKNSFAIDHHCHSSRHDSTNIPVLTAALGLILFCIFSLWYLSMSHGFEKLSLNLSWSKTLLPLKLQKTL